MKATFDAIEFLDGWTGRVVYVGQVTVCAHRHPTEAEAIACVRAAETVPLAPAGGSGRSDRTLVAPSLPRRQSPPPAKPTGDRAPAPAPNWHPAACRHRWCCCYNPQSHATQPACQHCRKKPVSKE